MTRTPALALLLSALLPGAAGADELLPPDRPIEQVVDHYLDAVLQREKVRPAPEADPAALLRRLMLDLSGRVPTPAELDEFLQDPSPERKARLVDRLLAAPAYARHQATEFTTFFQTDGLPNRKGPKGNLRTYLQGVFAENRPWDRVFRELMLPDDNDSKQQGAGEFLRARVKDLNRLTIDVSTLFFGVNVSCAQCHDHPHVHDWKQDHFYGMKAFFARTFENGGRLGERDQGIVKFTPNKGKEKVAQVMFLTGKVIDAPGQVDVPREKRKGPKEAKPKAPLGPPKFSLRSKFVETALEPEQRHFLARAAVNRTWHRLFGRGLVMPLDQMHSANPPSHPELLAWLARDFTEHGYDLRRLVRGLLLSRAYARTSRWEDGEAPAERLFAVAQLRPLTPAQMAVSLRVATLDPTTVPPAGAAREKRLETLEQEAGRLVKLFAQPADDFQVGVGEAMLFANNEGLAKELLADTPGTLVHRLKQVANLEQKAELAVRSVLSRPARPDEIKALADYLRSREDRATEACRQVVWALLTSAEFRFGH